VKKIKNLILIVTAGLILFLGFKLSQKQANIAANYAQNTAINNNGSDYRGGAIN
jgi:hypothetical protein